MKGLSPVNHLLWDRPEVKIFWLVASYFLIGVIGVVDYLTGYELAFSPFYLFPVILVTWLAGRKAGVISALLSALVWWLADYLTGHGYSSPALYFYNTLIRLLNFLVVSFLVARLKHAMNVENQLARSDVITGIANARYYLEFLDMEVTRAARYRHALTVVYLDLDNFKEINDRFGHLSGNEALRQTARVLRDLLREVDFVARIGGDEFAMVLPETGPDAAQVACTRIFTCLNEEMRKQGWPVTFSIGAVTAEHIDGISAEDLLRQADNLMYQVKKNGKNNLLCALYTL